jgi:uncharacterized membrane protein
VQRGLAVLFMIEVHALDAWLAPHEPRTALHDLLWMVGGLAAPGFLFMAGLSLALAAVAQERRGVPARDRLARGVRRAAVVGAAAYAFRALEYVLGGAFLVPGRWRDLLKVDVLNVMAVALLAVAVIGAAPRRARVALLAAAAALVAVATPIVGGWGGAPSWLVPWIQPRAGGFSIFPWIGFALAGAAAGELLAREDRPRATLAIACALVATGFATDRLPPFFAHQDFWHASPAWFAIRLGATVALAGALQLLSLGPDGIPVLRTLGRRSLLAYVASVELTYGLASRPLRQALSTGGVLAGVAALVALTWLLARAADRLRSRGAAVPPRIAGGPGAAAML